uniref:Uncharacterized protein n=1 Tax=Arundo donax TaxID=35708 RepID=A0A0A9GSK2_ARUDO
MPQVHVALIDSIVYICCSIIMLSLHSLRDEYVVDLSFV